MFTAYVLRSLKDGQLYTGLTSDLKRRLSEHNHGSSFSTKSRAPFELIYCEQYRSREDAKVREKYLKTGWGRNFLKRNLKNYFRQSKI